MPPTPFRSMLFVPADRPDRFEKALVSGADAVIIDLEDAVAVSKKTSARNGLSAAVPRREDRKRPIYIRVNDHTTKWWRDDIAAVADVAADGLMLPKAANRQSVEDVWREAENAGWQGEFIPILETAEGIALAEGIMAAGPWRVNFGGGDLSRDLGLTVDHDETILAPYRAMVVLAARVAGAGKPLDTVWADLNNDEGLAASARRAAAMGFAGKLCIHPRQVPAIHAAFTPSPEEVARARRVVTAFREAEAKGVAAIEVEGGFVDYPVAERARQTIDLAEAYNA